MLASSSRSSEGEIFSTSSVCVSSYVRQVIEQRKGKD